MLEGECERVAIEIEHSSTTSGRDLRGLRTFVRDQKARLGVVISNDVMPRQFDDDLVGVPFAWL